MAKLVFSPNSSLRIGNLDICVADNGARAVVVVTQAGKLRFRYTGTSTSREGKIDPIGISSDIQCQILTSDSDNNCIHIPLLH